MARLLKFLKNHDKSSHGWLSTSPPTVLIPSKPCLILACIVRIKIDVQTRYSATSKLEHVAETLIAGCGSAQRTQVVRAGPERARCLVCENSQDRARA